MEATRWGCRPSELLGIKPGSYEAYCLDQAVGYLGTYIQNEIEKAGHKPSKEERKMVTAREKVLTRYVGGTDDKPKFADPAALFG